MSQQWRQLLMSHIIPDIVPTGSMQDEQTIGTVNRHAKIRINFYNTPRRVRILGVRSSMRLETDIFLDKS